MAHTNHHLSIPTKWFDKLCFGAGAPPGRRSEAAVPVGGSLETCTAEGYRGGSHAGWPPNGLGGDGAETELQGWGECLADVDAQLVSLVKLLLSLFLRRLRLGIPATDVRFFFCQVYLDCQITCTGHQGGSSQRWHLSLIAGVWQMPPQPCASARHVLCRTPETLAAQD